MNDSVKKGNELIEKFKEELRGTLYSPHNTMTPIRCAIIAVEEIIEELPDTICGYMPEGGTAMEIDNYRKYFWNEVLGYLKTKQ